MGKARIATGVLLVTLATGAMGYTIASAVLTYQDLGFGAEIGISTQKLHARGPMGLEQLTTQKYIVSGTGQIRP